MQFHAAYSSCLRGLPCSPDDLLREDDAVKVHLVDGTYELFRQHYGNASRHASPPPGAAVVGVISSTLALLASGATHLGVATDHVVESFRNQLYDGYKTGDGLDEEILVQFPLLEEAMAALGVTLWPMIEFEADDALGSAAAVAEADPRVEQVVILTADKDLGQCVSGTRVVQLDRRKNEVIDEQGVVAKFGVIPGSIPDYLALVGDSSDGFPGLPGWGAKSAAAVLARYGTLEAIPPDPADWDISGGVRGSAKLAATLRDRFEDALLFRRLATIVTEVPVGVVDDWRWGGPTQQFPAVVARLGAPELAERAAGLASRRLR